MRNRFLEQVMRERDLEHERDIIKMPASALKVARGRPPLRPMNEEETKRRILERASRPGFRSNIAKEFGVSEAFVTEALKGRQL